MLFVVVPKDIQTGAAVVGDLQAMEEESNISVVPVYSLPSCRLVERRKVNNVKISEPRSDRSAASYVGAELTY